MLARLGTWNRARMTSRAGPARCRGRTGWLAGCRLLLVLLTVACGQLPARSDRADAIGQPASGESTPEQPSPDEREILALVNRTRAAKDLPPLAWAPGLSSYARSHTARMIARGDIFHDPERATRAFVADGWTRFGENVGMASSPETAHSALMRSREHRSNVLGDFTHLCVGAARGEDGDLYVTELFAAR